MLTVLFVFAILFGAYITFTQIDASSTEVSSYLRTEYKASALSQLN